MFSLKNLARKGIKDFDDEFIHPLLLKGINFNPSMDK